MRIAPSTEAAILPASISDGSDCVDVELVGMLVDESDAEGRLVVVVVANVVVSDTTVLVDVRSLSDVGIVRGVAEGSKCHSVSVTTVVILGVGMALDSPK
jgi:hypothetical protein